MGLGRILPVEDHRENQRTSVQRDVTPKVGARVNVALAA